MGNRNDEYIPMQSIGIHYSRLFDRIKHDIKMPLISWEYGAINPRTLYQVELYT